MIACPIKHIDLVDKSHTAGPERGQRSQTRHLRDQPPGGVTLADVEGNVQGTWEKNLRLARWADRLRLDAVVPIARWRG
jgi:hypothetical protein